MQRRLRALAFAAPALLAFTAFAAAASGPASGDWNFTASLDGKPIGRHRFTLTDKDGERLLHSQADFAVKFIGITAYRYHHQADERWRGDCLAALSSTTDDDGKAENVQVQPQAPTASAAAGAAPEALAVKAGSASETVQGCLMSFAYWNPAIERETRLLNAQTGKIETVNIRRAANGQIEVHGQPVNATHWRITGTAQPIDLWYSEHGDWIGLDSTVAGGRKLSYRLP